MEGQTGYGIGGRAFQSCTPTTGPTLGLTLGTRPPARAANRLKDWKPSQTVYGGMRRRGFEYALITSVDPKITYLFDQNGVGCRFDVHPLWPGLWS